MAILMATVIIGIVAYILLRTNCISGTSIEVDGFLFQKSIQATVDHELAKLMLTMPDDQRVQSLFSAYKDRPLDTRTLSEITKAYSIDVATFYFIQRIYQKNNNKQAQDLYATYLDRLSTSGNKQQMKMLENYYLAFVPGLNYKDTTNGGDFARQRRQFTENGVANEMIVTDDWGLTDDNAVIIAKRLRELSRTHKKIIVVSASKGGLETAVALGKILKPEETSSIKAWVSVGGVLRGSPVADTYLCWPKCWIAQIALLTKGKGIDLIEDVSYRKRSAQFGQLRFPDNIKIIHFVGAPLQSLIHKRVKDLYCAIKSSGPNDGLTPLADEITENGIVITEIGLDHHYKDPDIDKKTIALAMVVCSN